VFFIIGDHNPWNTVLVHFDTSIAILKIRSGKQGEDKTEVVLTCCISHELYSSLQYAYQIPGMMPDKTEIKKQKEFKWIEDNLSAKTKMVF